MADRPVPTNDELKQRLTPLQYEVTQHAATERAFSGTYWNVDDAGTYHCIVCDEPLFSSETKYDAGCGWPSFTDALDPEKITRKADRTHGMLRVETVCANCGAHLGHVFPDGPGASGDRFCMNSASLGLKPTT